MENETMIIQGKVKAISFKQQGKYSVCVVNDLGEGWYSAFGTPRFAKGDTIKVEFQLSEDARWKNAIRIDIVEKAPEIKPASNFTSINQDNARITMREAYIKDIVVAMINNKQTITLEDATDIAILCFTKIMNAVKEFK